MDDFEIMKIFCIFAKRNCLCHIVTFQTQKVSSITNTRNIDVTGLRDNEIELVSQLVDMLRNKK